MRRDDEIAIGIFSPHLHDSKYDGVYIKSSEMSNICKKLVGLPVLIEHEEGTNVGTVMAAWKDDAGNGKCIFSLDVDDSDLSKSVHEKIKSGVYKDLSLGHLAKVDMESLSVTEKVPLKSPYAAKAHDLVLTFWHAQLQKRASAREHKNANTIEAYILKMQGSNNNKRAEYLKMSSSENPQSDAKEDTSAAMSAASPEEKKSDAAPMDTSSDFNINDVQALMNELQKQEGTN